MGAEGLRGIGVIIDDDINDPTAKIHRLAAELDQAGIPCVKYTEHPEEAALENIASAAFIILDWKIQKLDGVTIDVDNDVFVIPNAELIREIKKRCFCPIFIFTNEEGIGLISDALVKQDVIEDKPSDMVLIRRKRDLLDGQLFDEVASWVKANPAVYTLMEWSRNYEDAKQQLFSDFYAVSPTWPKVLWEAYAQDGVSASDELGAMISRNLESRMIPFEFDPTAFEGDFPVTKDELRQVLAGEKFISNIPESSLRAGDVFKLRGGKHYINVRPDCDCINRDGETLELYLLRAKKVGNSDEVRLYSPRGNFDERSDECVIFNMVDSKTFSVKFKHLKVVSWEDVKDYRIGRLLPPHSTRLIQRYAQYQQRPGLPRIPKEAVQDE